MRIQPASAVLLVAASLIALTAGCESVVKKSDQNVTLNFELKVIGGKTPQEDLNGEVYIDPPEAKGVGFTLNDNATTLPFKGQAKNPTFGTVTFAKGTKVTLRVSVRIAEAVDGYQTLSCEIHSKDLRQGDVDTFPVDRPTDQIMCEV